jgi:hypothetical protein
MRPVRPDTGDTVRTSSRRSNRTAWALTGIVVLALGLGGSAAVWLLQPRMAPKSVVATAPAPSPAAATPHFDIVTSDEHEIAEHVPTSLTVFRFADNPRIMVLDFASLTEQGRMLNRVAAFTEKAELPHDRVLTESQLQAAIRERGDTAETFYFGHDYAAVDLARFFATAERDGVALNRQEGWLAPNVKASLISIPAVGSDPRITPAIRAGILRHELSHGEFFSNPSYADYVRNFWFSQLTAQEREGVRTFLGKDEYDVRVEELMYNEMQAYLMFTRDPKLFTPDMAGFAPARLASLQQQFLAGMLSGWLRDLMADYQPGVRAN